MAKHSLHDISPSSQEIIAFGNVLKLSFEAYKAAGYPIYYKDYLSSLLAVIQLGSAAIMAAGDKVNKSEFALEVDKLSALTARINYNIAGYKV